jgi:hypothetical protein
VARQLHARDPTCCNQIARGEIWANDRFVLVRRISITETDNNLVAWKNMRPPPIRKLQSGLFAEAFDSG